MIIGAGPIVIGQACEFDYSGTQACKALRQEGYRVILLNSNPVRTRVLCVWGPAPLREFSPHAPACMHTHACAASHAPPACNSPPTLLTSPFPHAPMRRPPS
jgi:hypothetical protein